MAQGSIETVATKITKTVTTDGNGNVSTGISKDIPIIAGKCTNYLDVVLNFFSQEQAGSAFTNWNLHATNAVTNDSIANMTLNIVLWTLGGGNTSVFKYCSSSIPLRWAA